MMLPKESATFSSCRFNFFKAISYPELACDGDGAELVEAPVSYLAVEDNLLSHGIRTVDVTEDSDVFRATAKRKGNCEGVAVTARKHPVFRDIFKLVAFIQGHEFVVNVYQHKNSTFAGTTAKVLIYLIFPKDAIFSYGRCLKYLSSYLKSILLDEICLSSYRNFESIH